MLEKRIKEVKAFLTNNDIELGFRRLLDCVMDTQQMDIYKEAIELTDWKESTKYNEEELIQKSNTLLEKITKINIIPVERTPILSAIGVEKTYSKRNFKLGPVTTEIKKGEIYGLVGENGNGKTTLLRALARELTYDKGDIVYNFKEDVSLDYDMRTKLVYIPQRTQRWYGSLQSNLKFVLSNYGVPAKEIETRVLIMVARFGLWKYKDLKWDELSSGYKMRFELARTMLRQPEVLLLDEPLANLDVLAQQVILEDLKSLGNSINNPIAIILSSQQLYEVEKVSDNVIFLKNGKQSSNENPLVNETKELIIEIETNLDRGALTECFKELQLKKIVYNGGMYFAYFDEKVQFNQVMKSIVDNDIKVTYLRNISNSTRRFFVS